jgi:putative spermidine/putrescine transport system permease protein
VPEGGFPTATEGAALRGLHARAERRRAFGLWLLVLPAVLFVLGFFVVPIAGFLWRSVDNTEVSAVLPRTGAALAAWDGRDLPPEAAFAALAADLRALPDRAAAAALGRRLNHNIPGFRTVVMRSAERLPPAPEEDWRAALVRLDRRWGDPAYWRVLRDERHPVTPSYLLAALDLERDAQGGIATVPADRQLFRELILRTLGISAAVTIACALLGFPLAYAMAAAGPRLANWMLLLVLLPFWTSLLVRATAWVILLQRNGLVNRTLIDLGLIAEPLALIYNRLGTMVVMAHVLLPFFVLPLFGVLRGIPRDHLRAASGLGAPPLTVFRRVYLPQAARGVAAGAALVFIMALGYYITPQLVGGPRDQMIAYFIAYFTADSVNWGMAAALSVLLLAMVALIYAVLARSIGLDRLRVR